MGLKAYVESMGHLTQLPLGESVVGRDLTCRIRFNDSAVSRRHVRFLVSEDSVIVEDLTSTNGTRLNGHPLVVSVSLVDGDEIQVGERTLRLRILGTDNGERFDDTTARDFSKPSARLRDKTLPSEQLLRAAVVPAAEVPAPHLSVQNCPRCHRRLPVDTNSCPHCGHAQLDRPWSITRVSMAVPQDIAGSAGLSAERRGEPRKAVRLPVVYTSESLTFDAVAHDLSHGGVFVETEILDPIGTECSITVLPDGQPALTFMGVVRHVVEAQADDTVRVGLGIQFTRLGADARRWLESVVGAA